MMQKIQKKMAIILTKKLEGFHLQCVLGVKIILISAIDPHAPIINHPLHVIGAAKSSVIDPHAPIMMILGTIADFISTINKRCKEKKRKLVYFFIVVLIAVTTVVVLGTNLDTFVVLTVF